MSCVWVVGGWVAGGFLRIRGCSSVVRSVEGGGGVSQMLTFAHKGVRVGTVNDH